MTKGKATPADTGEHARLQRLYRFRGGEAIPAGTDEHAGPAEDSSVAPMPATQNDLPHGWVPQSESVVIAGREIGGMVYVGPPPRLSDYDYWSKCRAYIDPSLPVARSGTDVAGHDLPYWPAYPDISANCRATYLDWLAGGARDARFNPGYMFLYFYGLEWRFFLDQPPESEKQEILAEVRRLKDLYPESGSVQRYLGDFIQFAQVSLNDEAVHEPVFDYNGWELPLSLKVAIGTGLERGDWLTADWLLSWFLCDSGHHLRTPATRCVEEFRALFRLRFEGRFPAGLKVNPNPPRKMLEATYYAASGEFERLLEPTVNGSRIPDISDLFEPVDIARKIAGGVMDDLDKLSRYLGRNPDARGSVEAQALLPQELWDLFPSKKLEQLKSWAATIVDQGGLVPVQDVMEQLEGVKPGRMSKQRLTRAADVLARVGYGFAPDPRFALRSPKFHEPVVLFELGEAAARLEDVSDDYRAALIDAALGSFVAHADGRITESERKSLLARAAKTAGLSEQEHRRLAANLEWMLTVAPDMALVRRKLKDVGPEAQASIRGAMIEASHADGIIQPEEVDRIEKVYETLGLDPDLAYSDLHAGNISDSPVRVRTATPGAAGEAIPDEKPGGLLKLDTLRIAAIRSDTVRVSLVLRDIFNDDPQEPGETEAVSTLLVGLDAKHTDLVKALIARDHWTEAAFQDLCCRSGLLASGAIEHINEWAHNTYDEALVDEYDGYEVTQDLAETLRRKFEEEIAHVKT